MYTNLLPLLALAGAAHAHMSLYFPPSLGADRSINSQSTVYDRELNFPLGCCGPDGGDSKPSPGPCRGHLDRFDIETASVTWHTGEDAFFQLTNYTYDPAAPGGTHSGGSCQVGFSTDKGNTWKLAASYHGACPHETVDGSPEAQTFDFKVPTNMPEGDALFTWVWLNREHESFVGCAKVHIKNGGSGDNKPSPSSQPPTSPTETAQPETPGNNSGYVTTVTTVVATTVYQNQAKRTSAPDTSASDDNSDSSNLGHAHQPVKANTRRYDVDGSRCDCTRDKLTLAARCFCNSKDPSVERKALRLHRRTFYKQFVACDWRNSPEMETSYYTIDAKCAPGAKSRMPTSDKFELGWDVPCGVVLGDTEYEIRTMTCDMYG